MKTLTITAARTRFGTTLDFARREPVLITRKNANVVGYQANKNSFVLNSLIVSLNFAAFSNSNRLAASRMSLSIFTM